jgi:hypothetical protein
VFPVFASPDESVRRDQRDAARFQSPRSSRARSKVVALGNRTVVTGAGSRQTSLGGKERPGPNNPPLPVEDYRESHMGFKSSSFNAFSRQLESISKAFFK